MTTVHTYLYCRAPFEQVIELLSSRAADLVNEATRVATHGPNADHRSSTASAGPALVGRVWPRGAREATLRLRWKPPLHDGTTIADALLEIVNVPRVLAGDTTQLRLTLGLGPIVGVDSFVHHRTGEAIAHRLLTELASSIEASIETQHTAVLATS